MYKQYTKTYGFRTLYFIIPNNKLIKVFNEIVSFVFNHKKKPRVGLSALSVCWTSKAVNKRFFTPQNLKHGVCFLIKNCFFIILVILLLNKILAFQWGIDPDPF